MTVGGNALGLVRDPGTIVRGNLTILRQHVDDLRLVTIGLSRRDVGGDDRVRTGAHGITPGVRLTRRCIWPPTSESGNAMIQPQEFARNMVSSDDDRVSDFEPSADLQLMSEFSCLSIPGVDVGSGSLVDHPLVVGDRAPTQASGIGVRN